jgi:pyruvate/2-oxoglutarate/acetoin dehydrogenase E1 component
MTYKEQITAAMSLFANDDRARFIGYGLANGRAGGTLVGAKPHQIVETPVAENLMTGVAIGLSLSGLRPVVYFERCDFILNALDAIVNHLSAARHISRGEFRHYPGRGRESVQAAFHRTHAHAGFPSRARSPSRLSGRSALARPRHSRSLRSGTSGAGSRRFDPYP